MIISKRDQFEVIKPRNLPKIGAAKHKVGGSKLKLMGQPPRVGIGNSTHACRGIIASCVLRNMYIVELLAPKTERGGLRWH